MMCTPGAIPSITALQIPTASSFTSKSVMNPMVLSGAPAACATPTAGESNRNRHTTATYENGGSHGFFHTDHGQHTEAAGLMKNFGLPHLKTVSGYTWIQEGLTTSTGNVCLQNRLYSGLSLGAIVHVTRSSSIWIQESYNKVVTIPWYTTSSIGYTYSW
jgi:hypothetical protein